MSNKLVHLFLMFSHQSITDHIFHLICNKEQKNPIFCIIRLFQLADLRFCNPIHTIKKIIFSSLLNILERSSVCFNLILSSHNFWNNKKNVYKSTYMSHLNILTFEFLLV